jgi:hypothetical protein
MRVVFRVLIYTSICAAFCVGCENGQTKSQDDIVSLTTSLDTIIQDTTSKILDSPKQVEKTSPVRTNVGHSGNCGCSKYRKSECEIRSSCHWIKGVGCRCN